MAYREEYTSQCCPECGERTYFQVVEVRPLGEVSRRGPSCWMGSCAEYQRNTPE